MGETNQTGELSIFLILCGVFGMLLLAIGIVVFVLIYQRKMLSQQNQIQLMKMNYQQELLQYTVQAQEKERKRIAVELHDGIGSLLSATKLYINHLSKQRNTDRFDLIHEDTKKIIDDVVQNVRTITNDLLPVVLEEFGLTYAIEDLLGKIKDAGTINIEFNYNDKRRFDIQQELAIYRITQELINNTLKYAKATHIKLDLAFKANQLHYLYEDNGVGFDYKSQRGKGLGLRNMESRAVALNTIIDYHSAIGEGVQFSMVIEDLGVLALNSD